MNHPCGNPGELDGLARPRLLGRASKAGFPGDCHGSLDPVRKLVNGRKAVNTTFEKGQAAGYDDRFAPVYEPWRPVVRTTAEAYLDCGRYEGGLARLRCDACGTERLLARATSHIPYSPASIN